MAEYPITEIVVNEVNKTTKEKWEHILGQHLRIRAFQVEAGLDYFTYGICIITMHFPFEKYLACTNCKFEDKASNLKYKWRNLNYILRCPKCDHEGPTKVRDQYLKDFRRIRLMRWNPEYVYIEQGFAGAEPIYTFMVPKGLKNEIMMGKTRVLNTVPDIYIEALKRNRNIAFAPENMFVMKRPIISQRETGWGMPLILPVLKDAFYLQILRKSQEAIASEHIVPLRVLFPQAGSGTSDPYTSIPIESWRSRIEREITKWKYDPNYIPVLPLPIGSQSIGGDQKALNLHQEISLWSEQIVAGMGVPREFVFGGLTFSGSNVSMRMLENAFINYRIDQDNLLNEFIIRRVADYMGWPSVRVSMRKFKMADDLQRMSFQFQLNQAMKISDESLLKECDHDPVVEKERKEREVGAQLEYQRKMQLSQAETQGQMLLVQSRYQAAAQSMLAPAMPVQPGAQQGAAQLGGQQGEMVSGDQLGIPGVPGDVSVSPENAQQQPVEGVPTEAQSPLSMNTQGAGIDIRYVAKRVLAQIQKLYAQDPQQANMKLEEIRASNPQLYSLLIQMANSRVGSQTDPLNPVQSPQPQVKPPRSPKSPAAA